MSRAALSLIPASYRCISPLLVAPRRDGASHSRTRVRPLSPPFSESPKSQPHSIDDTETKYTCIFLDRYMLGAVYSHHVGDTGCSGRIEPTTHRRAVA